MAKQRGTLARREKARRVHRSKSRRQQLKREFISHLEALDRDAAEHLEEFLRQEQLRHEEEQELQEIIAEHGDEHFAAQIAKKNDWGERAFESFCEAMQPDYEYR